MEVMMQALIVGLFVAVLIIIYQAIMWRGDAQDLKARIASEHEGFRQRQQAAEFELVHRSQRELHDEIEQAEAEIHRRIGDMYDDVTRRLENLEDLFPKAKRK